MTDRRTLHTAHALCPHCLRQLKADIYADDGGKVWMTRTCPEHGETVTYVWPDAKHYEWLRSMRVAPTAPKCRDYLIDDECPKSCGLCKRHLRRGILHRHAIRTEIHVIDPSAERFRIRRIVQVRIEDFLRQRQRRSFHFPGLLHPGGERAVNFPNQLNVKYHFLYIY